MAAKRSFRRSWEGKMVAGVCAGLAERLGWNVTLLRVIFFVGSAIPVLPGLPVYLLLWLLVPLEEARAGDRVGLD